MTLHILKIQPKYYNAKRKGAKLWEIRTNDRNFKVGDLVHYINVDGSEFRIGKDNLYKITYVLTHEEFNGLAKGYCTFSEEKIN